MINSGAFAYVDLLKSAADYSWTRSELINSNIANVDTPNYKRQDIAFESVLSAAVAKAAAFDGKNLTKTVRNIDYDSLHPIVYTDNSGYSYRIDGNNVDIDTEEVEMASNQLYYQGVIDSMEQQFNRLKNAMQTS